MAKFSERDFMLETLDGLVPFVMAGFKESLPKLAERARLLASMPKDEIPTWEQKNIIENMMNAAITDVFIPEVEALVAYWKLRVPTDEEFDKMTEAEINAYLDPLMDELEASKEKLVNVFLQKLENGEIQI